MQTELHVALYYRKICLLVLKAPVEQEVWLVAVFTLLLLADDGTDYMPRMIQHLADQHGTRVLVVQTGSSSRDVDGVGKF